MKKIIISLILIFSFTNTIACNCEDAGSVKEAYDYTESIISGTVIEMSFVSYENSMNKNSKQLREDLKNKPQKLTLLETEFIIKIKLKVNKVLKGKTISDTITIYTTRNGASCGYTKFEIGGKFIIYSSSSSQAFWVFNSDKKLEQEDSYWTNHCTRTKKYNENEFKELELLMNK